MSDQLRAARRFNANSTVLVRNWAPGARFFPGRHVARSKGSAQKARWHRC
jgi:hypothetical protein